MTALDTIRASALDADSELPFTPLQLGLLRAGLPILDEHDVRAYQARMLDRVRTQRRKDSEPGPVICLRAVLSTACGFCCAMFVGSLLSHWLFDDATLPVFVLGIMGAVIGLGAGIAPEEGKGTSMLAWRTYTLGFVGCGSITMPARYRATGVSQATVFPPAAIAALESLAGELEVCATITMEQLDDDPFLFVTHGEDLDLERYCIFAFDEDGYTPH